MNTQITRQNVYYMETCRGKTLAHCIIGDKPCGVLIESSLDEVAPILGIPSAGAGDKYFAINFDYVVDTLGFTYALTPSDGGNTLHMEFHGAAGKNTMPSFHPPGFLKEFGVVNGTCVIFDRVYRIIVPGDPEFIDGMKKMRPEGQVTPMSKAPKLIQ